MSLGAIVSAAKQAGKLDMCLHPAASSSTCGTVISAHTLQRSRVLKEISDESHHVLTFYPFQCDSEGQLRLHRKGWRQAATFRAFCDRHDAETFAPLETAIFGGTKEQVFLIAYRAICWELFQKARVLKESPIMRSLVDRGLSPNDQFAIQSKLHAQEMGNQDGHADLAKVKALMDKSLLAHDFSSYDTLEIIFDGPPPVAATGGITPNRSLTGMQLQVLHDRSVVVQWLAFGVDVGKHGFSFVFVWQKTDKACQRYIEDIKSLTDQELPVFLLQFIFVHCENTYFSPEWWESLGDTSQGFLTKLMLNTNPYYLVPQYDLSKPIGLGKVVGRK